jgi:MFS family permease
MQFLVLGWLVLEVTGSSTQLGLVVFLYGIPNVCLMLFGGVIADRVDRKWLLMVTQAAVGGLVLILGFSTATELVSIWHIYAAATVLGIVQALNMPARVALVADLVEERSLLDAVGLVNAAVHAGRIAGPALIGGVIELWGIGSALFFNAACYLISIGFLSQIGPAQRQVVKESQPVLQNIKEGMEYIRATPVVATVLIITCAFGGFGMAHLQVIPAFAKETLNSGAADVGMLMLASGVGSLIGALVVTLLGGPRMYRWLLACIVLFCVFLTLFSWSTWFWVSWGLFVVVGIVSLGTVWPLATTILQLETPRELRGRVMGALHLTPGFHYLGALPLAIVATELGWAVAISCAAGLSLLVALWFGGFRKTARNILGRGGYSAQPLAESR